MPKLDIPTQLTTDYLRLMIPQNWTEPSTADLIIWSVKLFGVQDAEADPDYEPWVEKMSNFPFTGCKKTICSKLDWQGDPDVSGIGVSQTSVISRLNGSNLTVSR